MAQDWRQMIHLEPRKGWMNDPNGLCFSDGKHHVYFQFSPDSPAVNVVDTTGAGDASIGSFLWKLNDSGITKSNIETVTSEVLEDALDFATKFCAISIQQKGAIPSYPTLEQVMMMGQS